MKAALSFHELAELELIEATEYYELERPGLGAAFLNEVERGISHISEHPESAPAIGGNVRRCLLHRFPYGLLYRFNPGNIRILAVMNLKRRPSYWVGRE